MELHELSTLLEKEKARLLQAKEFIESFYKQIFHSIINLRDTLFNHSFPTDPDWKLQLIANIASYNFQEYQLLSTEGRIQNNSDFIVNVLNNIQAVINLLIPTLENFTLNNIEEIRTVNKYTWDFVQRLYAKDNVAFLTGQRLEVANSIKANIKERLENNIAPFFNYLEQILTDFYAVKIRPDIQRIVGAHTHYMSDPHNYDRLIKERCSELKLEYQQELILNIIAHLSKDETAFIAEIKDKYQSEEAVDQKKNVYRLKEIAARFIAQSGTIHRLENFIADIQIVFQPVSLFTRFMNFLKKMLVGKNTPGPKKDFIFTYSSRAGKLEPKHASIQSLLKDIVMFKNFLVKFKSTLDFYAYTKNTTQNTGKELENIIDNCVTELTKIYEQCNGLREWLIGSKNQKNLSRMPVPRQEEFNDLLLALNYTLIINKQHLRDLDKHVKT